MIQPWPVLVPVIAISLLTIGINLVIDGYRRDANAAIDVGGVPCRLKRRSSR